MRPSTWSTRSWRQTGRRLPDRCQAPNVAASSSQGPGTPGPFLRPTIPSSPRRATSMAARFSGTIEAARPGCGPEERDNKHEELAHGSGRGACHRAGSHARVPVHENRGDRFQEAEPDPVVSARAEGHRREMGRGAAALALRSGQGPPAAARLRRGDAAGADGPCRRSGGQPCGQAKHRGSAEGVRGEGGARRQVQGAERGAAGRARRDGGHAERGARHGRRRGAGAAGVEGALRRAAEQSLRDRVGSAEIQPRAGRQAESSASSRRRPRCGARRGSSSRRCGRRSPA